MATNPGSLAGQIPPQGDGTVRRQADSQRDAAQQYAVLSRQVGEIATATAAIEQAQADLQAQAASLQNTVTYLAALKTYSSSDNGVVGNYTGGPVSHPETSPGIAFALTETMKVKITLRANVSLTTSGASKQTITANGRLKIVLDGFNQEDAVANAFLYQQVPPVSGTNQGASADSQLVSEVIATLGAGGHTATSNYASNGDGASVSVRITNRSMTVQVLGRP